MKTIDFYNKHAETFIKRTLDLDMRTQYEKFVKLIPSKCHILDAGCGAGRDTLYFLNRGYHVTAFDASPVICDLSSTMIGRPVLNITFQQLDFNAEFDGIWACASLLHIPRKEIDDVMLRLDKALRQGGILFASFKYGEGEVNKDGRLFNHYNEISFSHLANKIPSLQIIQMYLSTDIRRDRTNEQWINILIRKS